MSHAPFGKVSSVLIDILNGGEFCEKGFSLMLVQVAMYLIASTHSCLCHW